MSLQAEAEYVFELCLCFISSCFSEPSARIRDFYLQSGDVDDLFSSPVAMVKRGIGTPLLMAFIVVMHAVNSERTNSELIELTPISRKL